MDVVIAVFQKYDLVLAFAVIGAVMYLSHLFCDKVLNGKIHGSALAIFIGLVMAYFGGVYSGGHHGISDLKGFSGLSIMGGSMLRDFSIVATAYGVDVKKIMHVGLSGIVSLFLGLLISFLCGAVVAFAFGYTDAVSITTIGGGAVTYIVGPVTGAALGASSEVIALSITAGLAKSILTMVATPMVAASIGLNDPKSAIVFGGLLGTTSGVAAGLAATDIKLVPYGTMIATFYTGLGCLLVPSVFFLTVRALIG
ncbi:MAG: malonate transporter subunit MadM [Waddliaceae bacterium]